VLSAFGHWQQHRLRPRRVRKLKGLRRGFLRSLVDYAELPHAETRYAYQNPTCGIMQSLITSCRNSQPQQVRLWPLFSRSGTKFRALAAPYRRAQRRICIPKDFEAPLQHAASLRISLIDALATNPRYLLVGFDHHALVDVVIVDVANGLVMLPVRRRLQRTQPSARSTSDDRFEHCGDRYIGNWRNSQQPNESAFGCRIQFAPCGQHTLGAADSRMSGIGADPGVTFGPRWRLRHSAAIIVPAIGPFRVSPGYPR
jgi:hypothetical protein